MSSLRSRTLIAIAALLGAAVGCDAPGSQEDAQAAVDRWAKEHAAGWDLTVDERSPDKAFVPAFDERCGNDLLTLRYAARGYQIDLGFACPGPQGTDLAGLRTSFKYAALNVLPHGIDVPGWRFSLLTPSSSFEKGVQLTSWEGGRLTAHIDTELFQLTGQREGADCMAPADSGTPPQCLVEAELRGLPVRITISAPLAPETLMN
jgi:hypothetical protein